MIFLRRLLALLLIPFAIVSILAVSLVLRVNETLLEPQFWVDQLEEADVYEKAYSELLPAVVAVASDDQTNGAEFDLTRFNSDIVRIAREVIPPEWVQDRVEDALLSIPPYLLGEEDSFSFTIQFRDRIVAAAEVLKRETKNETVYAPLYEEGVDWAAEKAVVGASDFEVPIVVTSEEAGGYLRRVVPLEWLQESIDDAVDSVVPYLVGDADGFEITIALGEGVNSLAEVLREVLGKADTRELIIEEVVMPTVSQNLNGRIDVVSGVELSSEQVLDAVRETLTPDWVAEIQVEIIDGIADYLTGRADTLEFAIKLGDHKDQVLESLLPRVEEELASQFDSLPDCTVQHTIDAAVSGNQIPKCRPPGMTYDSFVSESGFDPVGSLTDAISPLIPEEFLFRESQLREVVGPESSETLDEVREWARDGLKFTHEDLLDTLDPEDIDRVNDARAHAKHGYTLTEQHFEDALDASGIDISIVDTVRNSIALARRFAPLAWIEVAFFLLIVGTLGGRNWGSRLGWAFVTLALGAGLLLGLADPLYVEVSSANWDLAMEEAINPRDPEVVRVADVLGFGFGRAIADEFASGLARTGMTLLIISTAGLGGSIVLQVMGGRSHRRRSTDPSLVNRATEDA